ncbi:MAG: GNAT family N-acetyltransferase [Cyanobacteria bacterium P01_A01_bin.105]
MDRVELDEVVSWAAAEGWNPGLQDADCFYQTDTTGFLVGTLDDEPIAAISAVKYGTTFGFIGFYLVKPAFRGQGYGWQMWQAAMASLAGRNVGLDGVVAQQANYLKSGFKLAYRNIRYEGVVGRRVERSLGQANTPITGTVPLAAVPVETVVNYDRCYFPADREPFVRRWLTQTGHRGLGRWQGDALTGYGILRPCQTGYKVGPLFADTPEMAEEILAGLTGPLPPQARFYLDTPDINPAAVALAEGYGMHRVFETARMYTQKSPTLPLANIFGVTTFELG